jgi:hypothetical protein
MQPNLATPSLLVQPVCSSCGPRLVTRVRPRVTWVDLPKPSISSGRRCRHHRRRPCNLVGRPWQNGCVPSLACVPVGGTPGSCDPPGCIPPPSLWVAHLLAGTLQAPPASRCTAHHAITRSSPNSSRVGSVGAAYII